MKMNDTTQNNIQMENETDLSGRISFGTRVWDTFQFLIAFAVIGSVLFYLIKMPADTVPQKILRSEGDETKDVRILQNGDIQLGIQSSLFKRLKIVNAAKKKSTDPLFEVTGIVAASYRANGDEYRWQFQNVSLLTLFTEWQKAVSDVTFNEKQLASTKELAETKIRSLKSGIDRKRKLVKIGTDTEQDLASTEAELLQIQIEERKNIYEAETAIRNARKMESTLSRQLEQEGLNPVILQSISNDKDIIVGNVPGVYFEKVLLNQECRASFQSMPGIFFSGKICNIIPVLSQELRTISILFIVDDPKDLLRPGMFADIGIGVEEHEILCIPAEAVIHVGDSDYVLARKKDNIWKITKIRVGRFHNGDIEILAGLSEGDQVAGQGVILLKGYITEALDEIQNGSNIQDPAVSQDPLSKNVLSKRKIPEKTDLHEPKQLSGGTQ